MAAAERHLLFGLLALQNGLINQGQLVAAFQAWTLDKSQSLADHLEARGDLSSAKRALLESLAEVHLEAHGGDVEKSLAAVPAGKSTRERLAALRDPDIEGTLVHVGSGHGSTENGDADRTASYAVGTTTSDGQRFRVLRPHARGGLGAVFVALDTELHREVALKQILDSHSDDPTSRQRFLLEAEITGGLEHPGIVPVYGLGTYGDGRPYYAMRFIRGDNLKEAIDRFHADDGLKSDPGRRALELHKLLRRFLDVCNAVDYAHSRGVLHRDIKPGNVIVGRHGETLVVDWGLAKATGKSAEPAEERTLRPSSASGSAETLPGSAMGTPAYMSPEQARGELDRLGPRSDVYSLGATLYCLLTGRPPLEGDVGEVLRRAQTGDIPPPHAVDPAIDRALEAVCLKAMAPDPGGRYASCKSMAEDVERWLADEPVSAWREPLARLARRWARRHRSLVTGAAAALLAGTVGLAAVLAVQTKAKADLADTNAELTRSRAAVQARYDLAVEAIKTFHTGVSEDFLLKQDQFKDLRDRLLKSASDYYGKLGALLRSQSDFTSRRALLQANFEVANLTGTVGSKEDALAIHREVLAARESMARERLADPELTVDVGRSLTAVAAIQRQVGKTDEAPATYRRAMTLLDDPARPPTAAARALLSDCHTGLGLLLFDRGDPAIAEAEAEHRQALAIAQKLVDENADVADYLGRLAESHYNLALTASRLLKQSEAGAEYRQAMTLYRRLADDHPAVTEYRMRLVDCHLGLGWVLYFIGTVAEADVELREALRICRKLVDDYPGITGVRRRLADCHHDRHVLMIRISRPADAEAELREAVAIYQRLVADHPTVTEFRVPLATSRKNLAGVLLQAGKPADAGAEYRQVMALYQKLADDDPAVSEYRKQAVLAYTALGEVQERVGKPADAEAEYRRATVLYQKLIDDHPSATDFRSGLAETHLALARLALETGRQAEAEDAYRRAIALYRELADDHPGVTNFRERLAYIHTLLGGFLSVFGKPTDAEVEYRWAISLHQRLAGDHPGEQVFGLALAGDHYMLGQFLWQTARRPAEAEAEYRQFMAISQKLADDHPGSSDLRGRLAGSHEALGWLLSQTGKPAEAEAEYRQALAIHRKVADDDPGAPLPRRYLAQCHHQLGVVLSGANKPAEAEVEFRRALAIQQKLVDDHPTTPWFRTGLAETLASVGRSQQAAGHWALSGNAFRRAVEFMERLPRLTADNLYDLACYQALLSGVLNRPGSGSSAAESGATANWAMRRLREAVTAGFRNLAHMRTDTDLDPLRPRLDFQLLMMDLTMPGDPFAPPP